MKKRITISLDEKLIWTLRNKQIEMMLDNNNQVSISAVVNKILTKSLKVDEMINKELDSVFVNPNVMHFQVDKI